MRHTTRTIALMTALVLPAVSFESLAQNTTSTKQVQVKNQQKQMAQHTIWDQAQATKGGQKSGQGQKAEKGKKSGPADGSGNRGNRPQDGTGYGSNSGRKTGPQDGTGPNCRPGGRNSGGSGKGRQGGRN